MMKQAFIFSSVCVGLLFGCADVHVAEYQRPEAPAKSTWSRPPATTVSTTEAISTQWWAQFVDPYLDSLVSKAIAGNVDLKSLAARTAVANAQIAEARAGALPSVDIAAGSSLQKTTGQQFSKQFNLGTTLS